MPARLLPLAPNPLPNLNLNLNLNLNHPVFPCP